MRVNLVKIGSGIAGLAAATLLGAAVWAQAPAPAPLRHRPGVQAARDSREPEVLKACKHPPPEAAPMVRPPGFIAPSSTPREYHVTAITAVVKAGETWKTFWSTEGNNADGIIGTDDGGLLVAQNDNSAVVKLDKAGHASVQHSDTDTGGALSINKKGALYIVERALNPAVWQLAPERRLLANRFQDDVFDCVGTVINDLAADVQGGVYFTMGGLFYADRQGQVTRYGEDLHTNGIMLSADEKTLYVTNRSSIVAFEVQADGALTHQREFAKLPESASGDGMAIDRSGRLYVTGGHAVHVISAKGEYLGAIPTPFSVISVAFGGPRKKTLYAVGMNGDAPKQAAVILALQTQTAGYQGRPK